MFDSFDTACPNMWLAKIIYAFQVFSVILFVIIYYEILLNEQYHNYTNHNQFKYQFGGTTGGIHAEYMLKLNDFPLFDNLFQMISESVGQISSFIYRDVDQYVVKYLTSVILSISLNSQLYRQTVEHSQSRVIQIGENINEINCFGFN
ncbi:Hypothetical_protein [Hexamita inflata]|uniref:Hypothetical_protein n=1 Tax=Hexamita inflata TaxID=28002 RepID=A0AA86QC80_9EUKA|nr:Hypothetical protein HINF_LOCUS44209 [Hexamita inflata]